MPQGYRNNSLANNPYVGIDVDYFDRKALEKQQRHDVARENYSKFVQDVANQSYLDPDARNEYLKEQQKQFENVVNKYSGNLSAGYQDILGAIEQSKLSPYHNLNKRHVEQEKLRQDLTSQYGAEAIDLSNMPDKLYQRDKEGNINWVDPNNIGAKVVKADNYQKIIEDMLAQTAAHEFTTQTGITGGSGNPWYLMSKITKGEVLSPQELQQISMDPSVQQAFLANASTSGIDNRKVPGTEDTYKDMFADPNKLAQYIYGNIQDKQRNNIHEQKQFMSNRGMEIAQQHANKKKELDYEYALKNVHLNDLTTIQDWGVSKVNNDKLISHKEATDKVKQTLDAKNEEIKKNTVEFTKLTGIPVGDFSIYTDKFGNINKKLVGIMMKRYGKNEDEINSILNNKDIDMLHQNHNDLVLDKYNLNREVEDANQFTKSIYGEIADEFYGSLSQHEKDEWKKFGITSSKDLVDKHDQIEKEHSGFPNIFSKEAWKDFFGSDKKPVGTSEGLAVFDKYLKFKNNKLTEGFAPKSETVRALFNADPNSIPGQFSQLNQKVVEDMGLKGYLNLLQTKTGDNYMDMNEDLKDFVDKYSAGTEPGLFGIGKKAKESDYKIETKFGMSPNQVTNGFNPLIKLQVKDSNNNIIDEFTVVDAKLNNDNAIAQEFQSRLAHFQDMTYSLDPNHDEISSDNAYYQIGKSNYGEQSVKLMNDLEKLNPGDIRTIPFILKNGTPSHITFEKTQVGYRSLVGTGKGDKVIENFHMDPVKLLDLTFPSIGWASEKINNPNTETNYSFYPKNSDKAPTVNQNLAKDKEIPEQEITE